MCTVRLKCSLYLILSHSAFALYMITAVTWLTANPRYFTVPGSFACSFTAIMGCRIILNLCQVYYIPSDMAARPQSIWAGSRGIRFGLPASSVPVDITTDEVEMERAECVGTDSNTLL